METRTVTLTLAHWAMLHAALDALPVAGLGNQRLVLEAADAIAAAVNQPAPQAEVVPAKTRRSGVKR
jgi:hypothetical protein